MIKQILEWFEQVAPKPTHANKAVQIGCHFEEVGEMAEALGDTTPAEHILSLGHLYKRNHSYLVPAQIDKQLLLDSLCDQIVTAVGIAHMFDMDIMGALMEINRANYSKFVDGKPVWDENGKVKKGPNYVAPDLRGFVQRTNSEPF